MPTSSGTLLANIKGIGSGSSELGAYVRGCHAPDVLDFSLDVEEYTSASGSIWVDIADYYLPLNTNNTYFSIDGTVVSGTFTPITVSGLTASGTAYRMSYNPLDDFSSLQGATSFTVHAENDWGCWTESNYYLTFGYEVEFENEVNKYIDFGYDSQVVVRVLVENSASCTKESGYAYWFTTIHDTSEPPYTGPDYQNQAGGLTASITSEAIPGDVYMYGRTMEITIRAKDFSGNEMEPYVLVYTIEEQP